MAFYIKKQAKVNNKWYPRSITVGKPVSTDNVADKLAELSTVTRGDAYAILKNLGSVMASYMASGRTVKLEGVGTFYYSLTAAKQGVDTAEEVSANQITAVRVRFIPEVTRNPSSQVSTRSLREKPTQVPCTLPDIPFPPRSLPLPRSVQQKGNRLLSVPPLS